ncbi:MAG: AtpZ/AtpI family protein [Patescibacteria group bacterium]|jgi:hypothetical protein
MDEKTPKNNDREYYYFALRIAGNFGAAIAIPVVVLALVGRNLDTKYHTGSTLTIIGFVTAAVLSGILIYRNAKKYGKEYQSLVDKKSK